MSNRRVILLSAAGFLLASLVLWAVSVYVASEKSRSLLEYARADFIHTFDECRDFSMQVSAKSLTERLETVRAVSTGDLRTFARETLIDEINVVDRQGTVVASTLDGVVGRSMLEAPESAAFMVLTNEDSWVYSQPTRCNVDDHSRRRKYLGFAFADRSGFVQVGIDDQNFYEYFGKIYLEILRGWRVGDDGYYLCFDRETGKVANEPPDRPELVGLDAARVCVRGQAMDIVRLQELAGQGQLNMKILDEWCDATVVAAPHFVIVVAVPWSEFYDNAYFVLLIGMVIFVVATMVFLKVVFKMRRDADSIARLRSEEDAQREKDMAMAQSIQQHALPTEFPPYPELAPIIDLYAIMRAAKEVGGDFYDFGYIGGNRFSILIADVSGKGVPGAMFMMRAKSTLKSLIATGRSLAATVSEVNQRLCEGNTDGLFVTAWIGIVNLATGGVAYVNAGHNPPLLKHADGAIRWLEDEPDLPLAAMDVIAYSQHRLRLELGDMLVLYTDGVTEASDGHGGFSGERRLEAAVRAASGGAQDMSDALRVSVDTFAGAAPQADDITVLSFGFNGARRIFPASDEGIRRSTEFVRQFNLGSDAAVVFDEVVSNIVRCSGTSEFTVEVRRGGTLVFIDDGMEFDPLKRTAPDVDAPVDARQTGGLGIYLVRQLAEEVKYERRGGKNILTVKLKTEASQDA